MNDTIPKGYSSRIGKINGDRVSGAVSPAEAALMTDEAFIELQINRAHEHANFREYAAANLRDAFEVYAHIQEKLVSGSLDPKYAERIDELGSELLQARKGLMEEIQEAEKARAERTVGYDQAG